jgi:protein-S-isoprenylcysteine O-methyltransferase Ste14
VTSRAGRIGLGRVHGLLFPPDAYAPRSHSLRWLARLFFAGRNLSLSFSGRACCSRRSFSRRSSRIRAEERLLRTQYASEYDALPGRTWRLVPGLY